MEVRYSKSLLSFTQLFPKGEEKNNPPFPCKGGKICFILPLNKGELEGFFLLEFTTKAIVFIAKTIVLTQVKLQGQFTTIIFFKSK
ncbi:MAG: hypothetical protein LBD88_01910 [Candidatus Peribacteria bacterium]|jgi:hypothetical protein|nr:hypothetical protein [Candidatus Peribacteria bacterium]